MANLARSRKRLLKRIKPEVKTIFINQSEAVKIKPPKTLVNEIVSILQCGENPFIFGGHGTGKTTLAREVANKLELDFYVLSMSGVEVTPFGKIMPSKNGLVWQPSPLAIAAENGGICLLDEMDAAQPDVLVALHHLIEDGEFWDGENMQPVNENFHLIAAGNTDGKGDGISEYTGRKILDSATLSRFVKLELKITPEQLAVACGCQPPEWCKNFRQARQIRNLQAAGFPMAKIANMLAVSE